MIVPVHHAILKYPNSLISRTFSLPLPIREIRLGQNKAVLTPDKMKIVRINQGFKKNGRLKKSKAQKIQPYTRSTLGLYLSIKIPVNTAEIE